MKRIGLAIIILLLLIKPAVNAQGGNDLSLGINPPLLEITAEPPAEIMASFSVENKSENKVDLNLVIKPFKFSSRGDGHIEYLPANTFMGRDPEFFQKIKVYDGESETRRVTLGPLESRLFNLRINLDESSPPSDYYFSLLFISEESRESESSSISTGGIGTNVILSVGGKDKAAGSIEEFTSPSLIAGSTVPFTLSVFNKSDRFVVPEGKILIRDMFGRSAGEISLPPRHILSNSRRYMDAGVENRLVWKGNFLFGLYSAKAQVRLEANGDVMEKSTRFLVIPLYFMFALSFLSFLALSIYVRVRKKVSR